MPLPKIDLPIYDFVLPSTGETIKIRPFTVKEEKILLIAKESKELSQIISATKQIINNCLVDKDVDELAVFDLEYLLVMIRSKSINNIVEFKITDDETFEEVELVFDLEKVKLHKEPDHENQIKINDEYTLFMKYPSIDMFMDFFKNKDKKDPLAYYNIMISCLDKLVGEEEVYKIQDFSKAEINEFMESLENKTVTQIQTFFETMPRLRHEIEYKNSAGNKKTFVIEGTESFFM